MLSHDELLTGGDKPYLISGADDKTVKVRIFIDFFWRD